MGKEQHNRNLTHELALSGVNVNVAIFVNAKKKNSYEFSVKRFKKMLYY